MGPHMLRKRPPVQDTAEGRCLVAVQLAEAGVQEMMVPVSLEPLSMVVVLHPYL
jgi:hypothetical protein